MRPFLTSSKETAAFIKPFKSLTSSPSSNLLGNQISSKYLWSKSRRDLVVS